MDYRKLGDTGMGFSEIGFGCGDVGGLKDELTSDIQGLKP